MIWGIIHLKFIFMKCVENRNGMFAVEVRNERSSYLLTKFEIELAIEKFGDYSITNIKRGGNEIQYCTNLPFEKYYRLKDKLRLRKNHLTN